MDINSLLSPSESPVTETPPPLASPSPRQSPLQKRPGRPSTQTRKSSGLSQQLTLSPRASEQSLPSLAAHNAATVYQTQQGGYTQPSGPYQQQGYAPVSTSSAHVDPRSPSQPQMNRQGSTPGMDTLADLASMQHQQHTARQNTVAQQESPRKSYNLHNLPRSISARSGSDITMAETPVPTPRVFVTKSLSLSDRNDLADLAKHLSETPFDFQAHVRFINLLRKGFADHVETGADRSSYELLADLREARQTMDKIFPLGERLWADWLNDEKYLARTIEDRLGVMDLFRRAISDEASSASLWRLFGDYMYQLWSTAYDVGDDEPEAWSAEDKEIGRDVFKWEPMMAVWEQGVAATQRRLNDSHLVWDRYMEMLLQDNEKWPKPEKVQNIKTEFASRLATSHATWDQTSQMYLSFISKFEKSSWEDTMVALNDNQRNQQARRLYALREPHEMSIQKAASSNDEAAEWAAYSEYLDWELRTKGVSSFPLINGLYERATIRFPSVPALWNDYVDFLIENPTRDMPVLALLERATRHCPWSGDLWSQRLLTMEAEGKDFTEIETTKHDATATGLLDVGGLDELMKVYIAWCGCLRRRAFEPGATEDELDIAEVAIRSSLEHVKEVAEKKHGKEYVGDPQYRLERIHIKFLTQRGDVEAGRSNWKALVPFQGNNYDFWYRYYIWEMVMWAKFAMRATNEPETQLRTPEGGTAVLREALSFVATMDWPEQLLTMFLNHCEQHESVHELRKAVIEARRATKIVTQRREKEAAAYQQQQSTPLEQEQSSGKRKRDSEASALDGAVKRTRADELVADAASPSAAPQQPVRDREHAVMIMKGIPSDATEQQVRQFFRDVGTIQDFKMVPDQMKNTLVATIEFETEQDAMYAQTKSVRPFQGHDIEIEFGSGTTIYATNYPPEADKQYIRDLFQEFGEILDIRLPSLQGNTRRRFCYIQFANPEQAHNATSLHGKELGGEFKLSAKIADPQNKVTRKGALEEGREIYITNVYWHAREEEIEELFSSCGTIESVRIPKDMRGKSKGHAFVIFADKLSAETAVQKYNDTEFRHRNINVVVARPQAKRTMNTIVRRPSASPSPSAGSPSATSVEMNGESGAHKVEEIRSRTIALLNVPDTVTPVRIEKLFARYGDLVKHSLRPDHAGATAEYVEASSVGKAMLALDGMKLDGNIIRTATVPELLRQRPERKNMKPASMKPAPATPFAGLAPQLTSQPSTRGGGKFRGGLGAKRWAASSNNAAAASKDNTGGKSNDFFKSLVAGGKQPDKQPNQQEDVDKMET